MAVLLAGLSHETLALARRVGLPVDAVCDPSATGTEWHGLRCFPDDGAALQHGPWDGVILAIDIPRVRAKVQRLYAAQGVPAVDVIDGFVDDGTTWGGGLLLQRTATISTGCRLGEGVRLNVGALVMHDVELGDHVTVAPRAVVLGRVRIGACSYVGANATVMTDVAVGANCVIGAGAVVTRDVPDGSVVKGVPAR